MPPFFTSLPETVWAEVNRRLRLEPALWELTTFQNVIAAFLEAGSDLALWRPGQLGLAALAILEPLAAADPFQWLKAAGRERLARAYNALASPETPRAKDTKNLPALVEATLAAVALHQRLTATHDLDSIVAEAAAAPERWALPLVCLYGLLDDPQALVVALLNETARHPERVTSLCELAARILIENETPEALIDHVAGALPGLPLAVRLAFARFLAANGLDEAARAASVRADEPNPSPALEPARIASASDLPALFRALADGLERIFLAEFSADDSSPTLLGRAVEAAQSLTAELALHFGRRSLAHGDPVSAIAAFQEAQALRPYDRQTHALIAEASALRGDDRTAHIALGSAKGKIAPAAQLAAARAHRKLGDVERARETALAILNSPNAPLDTDVLTQAAELLAAAGDHPAAAAAWQAVIARRPAHPRAFLVHSQHALEMNQLDAALDSAWQAVGLNPADPTARITLAEILSRSGDAVTALTQWKRAADLDPSPDIRLKLAQAALAARQFELAFNIADRILRDADAEAAINTGLPYIVAGHALASMSQPERAFEYFNRAIALAPASVESWRAVAAHHRAQGDLQRALAALDAGRQVIDSASPEAAELFADLGELRAELHHLAEATAAFEKATQLLPRRTDFMKRLGELYRLQNKLPAAVEVIRRAATMDCNDPGLWHLLGQTLESAGQQADALAAYRHAQAVGGEMPQLFRDLGRLACQLNEPSVARAALEAVLLNRADFRPDDLDSLVLLGAIYEQSGEFDSALSAYKHAIALAPARPDLCVRLGVCCLELGQPEAAIAALKDAAERDLDNLVLQKLMGHAYAEAHLWTESELAYQQAARLAPDDHRLLQSFARVARQAGHTARAIDALQKAIALAPGEVGADYRRDLAELFMSVGKLAEAKAAYIEACSLIPQSHDLLMGLGQVHLMLNEVKDAAAAFEQAASINPNRADVMQAVGETQFLLGNFEPAHAAFARAAELDPGNPLHLRRAGECMWELGRQAVAVALWQKVLVAHPNDAACHTHLGSAFAAQGRHAESLVEFEAAIAASSPEPPLLIDAARAALNAGEAERALAHLERASRIQPDDAEVWLLLGQTCRAQGLADKALAAYRKAARLKANNGPAHAAIAELLAESGSLPEAVTAAEAALRAGPDNLDLLAAAARVFTQAGRIADAAAAALKVAQGRPNDPAAQMALGRALVLEAESQTEGSRPGRIEKSRQRWPESHGLLTRSLERAAALGADPMEVREWTGRARALYGEPADALPFLEAAASSRPSGDLLCVLAACYRRLAQLAPARQTILSALELAPDNTANVIELGLICLALDDRAAARAAFQRAIGLDLHCARAYQLLAETLIGLGERAEAIVIYSQAISLDPARAAWHHRLAELCDLHRDPASALAHYQRAAALAIEQDLPALETANYLAALARAYARDHDLEAARKQFEAALALRGDSPTWWAQCAQINFELRNFERALECFGRAGELQPGDTASHMGAARSALALGREAEAEEKALAILRYAPDNYDALIVMAEVFERRADFSNALLAYTRAVENTNHPIPALLAQTRLLRSIKRLDEAVATLDRVIELAPEDDEAAALLGEILAEANRAKEAVQSFQRAIQIAPRKLAHHIRIARLYRIMGQLDAALGHLQHAREFAPENTEALREMALVFEGRRQFNRAYELYQQLMMLEPANADHFFRAGLALKEMRDYLESAELFQRAARLDPTNVEAERQRATVAAIGILRGKS